MCERPSPVTSNPSRSSVHLVSSPSPNGWTTYPAAGRTSGPYVPVSGGNESDRSIVPSGPTLRRDERAEEPQVRPVADRGAHVGDDEVAGRVVKQDDLAC